MKTCYMCHGELKREFVQTQIDDVVVTDVSADVCQRCGERYYDTNTATFIQKVTKYIEEQKRICTLEIIKEELTAKA